MKAPGGKCQVKRVGKEKLSCLDWLLHGGVEDVAHACRMASRADLIDAHRWCERNPQGNKRRKAAIAAALLRLEQGRAA